MKVKRCSNTVILAFVSFWIFSLTNTVYGEDATPNSHCEIIKEALHSENPEKHILTLRKRKIDLNQFCDYPIGGNFFSLPSLVYAVKQLELPIVKALIESGANVNAPDEYGMTPIMWARDLATVQYLLKSKANVNIQAGSGWTPLLWQAISRNDEAPRIIEAIIKSGARVNQQNENGDTALTLSASRGDNEMVRLLINAKADLNLVDNNHNSALMIATKDGASETVKLLIAANANPTIKNKAGQSALDLAIQARNRYVIALLQATEYRYGQATIKPAPNQRFIILEMQDSNYFHGYIIRENEHELVILNGLGRLQIMKSQIAKRISIWD